MPAITLATLAQATQQEVFDQVVTHLIKQANRALNDGDQCQYRGNEGSMCAAGCLIGDDEYLFDMEGKTWPQVVESNLAPDDHSFLIRQLQFIHDQTEPSLWRVELEKTALKYDLVWKH